MDLKRLPGVGDVIPNPDCRSCYGVGTFLRLMPTGEVHAWADGKEEPVYSRAIVNCLCRIGYAA